MDEQQQKRDLDQLYQAYDEGVVILDTLYSLQQRGHDELRPLVRGLDEWLTDLSGYIASQEPHEGEDRKEQSYHVQIEQFEDGWGFKVSMVGVTLARGRKYPDHVTASQAAQRMLIHLQEQEVE